MLLSSSLLLELTYETERKSAIPTVGSIIVSWLLGLTMLTKNSITGNGVINCAF